MVRITIVFVSIYFILAYLTAQFLGIDILDYSYSILFEICTVVFCFSQGKYHCRYIRWTALSLLLCDIITTTNFWFNYLSTTAHNLIPIAIMALGIGTSITLAFRHFYEVIKLQNLRNGRK